jgi:TetR/AcrR family transcriptional repressor of nem operon
MSRDKTFNEEEVLMKVLQIFWLKGYSKTSMKDLEMISKLTKPSLYNAFGNKEDLYLKCLDIYYRGIEQKFTKLPEGLSCIEFFFKYLLKEIENKDLPNGCLIMNSAIEFSSDPSDKKTIAVTKVWKLIESNFQRALEHAKKNNQINSTVEVKSLARWLMTQLLAIRGFSKISPDIKYTKAVVDEVLRKLLDLSNVQC